MRITCPHKALKQLRVTPDAGQGEALLSVFMHIHQTMKSIIFCIVHQYMIPTAGCACFHAQSFLCLAAGNGV